MCGGDRYIWLLSMCPLNHSALQHVNEAIHRRVTHAAPSCFGRGSSWVVPARAKRVSRTFRCSPGRIFIPSLRSLFAVYPFSSLLLCLSFSLSFFFVLLPISRDGNFSRENSRHAPPLLQRIFSRSLDIPRKSTLLIFVVRIFSEHPWNMVCCRWNWRANWILTLDRSKREIVYPRCKWLIKEHW